MATAVHVQTETKVFPSFQTETAEMATKIPMVLRAIDRRDPSELYAGMVVRVDEAGNVTFQGANALWNVLAKIPTEKVGEFEVGEILVNNPHNMSALLAKLPTEETAVRCENGQIVVESGRSKGRYPLLEEEPPKYSVSGEEKLFLRSTVGKLTDFFKSVVYAAARGDTYTLSAIRSVLVQVDDMMIAVATDSNRLATAKNEAVASEKHSAIFPIEAIDGIMGVFARLDDETEVSIHIVGDRAARFTCGDGEVVITTRLVDGLYPNWRQVIPNQAVAELKATVDRNHLLDALSRVATASDGSPTVSLRPQEDGLLVSLVGMNKNGYEEFIEARVEGFEADKEYAFNAFNYQLKFLTDALGADPSSEVKLHFNPGDVPLLLTGDGLVEAVIMPIKIG